MSYKPYDDLHTNIYCSKIVKQTVTYRPIYNTFGVYCTTPYKGGTVFVVNIRGWVTTRGEETKLAGQSLSPKCLQ